MKVGDLVVSGRQSATRYAISARFRATGLAGALRPVRFSLQASGSVQGAFLYPALYREEVDTDRRSSAVQLEFDALPPHPKNPPPEAIDPLSALFLALRDQPASETCRLTQDVFDGTRRTRLVLTSARPAGADGTIEGGLDCSGRFIRVAGYPPQHLAQHPAFDLLLSYRPAKPGQLQLVRARLHTIHGPVTLLRR